MASAPQQGSAQPSLPQNDNSPPSPLSWEGDKMFNIYIYDYCFKRGFRKTARELMSEAEIAPDSTPPINARQGLLFEWWSVFWVLFTAKANGSGTDEAMLYTQHQAHQLAQRQAAQRPPPPPGPGQSVPLGQPPMHHQPPPPMSRLPNGIAPRQGGFMTLTNGPMTNGVGPPPGPMQSGGPNFSMPGAGPHPNGIPGQPGPPPPGSIPAAQPPNFQSLLPGQRPSIGGGMPPQQPQQPPQQQRGPNGPFQSPNMANSPQHTPGQQPQQHPQQQQHPQPPMGQLGGPSPHLTHMSRGGMLPPNQGMNPMNPQQGPPGQQGNPLQPSQYQQAGRPPSRTATPGQGQGGMMHRNINPSPSLAARQPPGGGGQLMTGGPADNNINSQLMAIPQANMTLIKQELGIEQKDFSTFTPADKQQILNMHRNRQKPGGGVPDNAAAGPSNQMMQNQQQRNQQQRNQPQQQPQQRGKRNSTSPGEEHENLSQNDSSPPDRKRLRRSPLEQPAAVPVPYNHPQQQHPQQQGGPQSMMMGPQGQGMMMRGGPMMVGGMNGGQHPGQQMGGGPMNMGGMGMGGGQQPMGVPQMGSSMNPGMGHPMTPHMQNQLREQAFRQQMGGKGPQQQGGMGNMPGNAVSPQSSDPSSFNMGGPLGQGPGGGPSFNPGLGPNRLGPKMMMPPPSPANGPPKDQNNGPGGPNNAKNPNMPTNHGSPRNHPPNNNNQNNNNSGQTPNANGTGPPTPAPGNQQIQNQGGGPGPGQLGVGGQNMAPSPSSLMGGPPMNVSAMGGQPSLGGADMAGGIFSSDFIQSVASSLDELDGTLFRPDGDINFERDFGQWFNPDDVGGALDGLK